MDIIQTTKKSEQMNRSFKNINYKNFNVIIKEYRDFDGKQYPHESNINKNDILDSMIEKKDYRNC